MRKRTFVAVMGTVLLAACQLAAQSMPDFTKARDETIDLLQTLVRIDTSNPPGNEIKVSTHLKSLLDKEGIPSEILEKEPGRSNLIARLKGSGKKKPILLMGHQDVVGIERDKWTVDPFAAIIKDGYLYGRGSLDDKAGVVAMFQVMRMIKRQKIALDRDIIFLAEAGEEGGPPVGIDFIIEQHWPKIECEFALNEGGEVHMRDGKADFMAVQTGEKLPRALRVVARGVSGHGSIPRLDNPVLHLSAALAKIGEYQPPMRLNETTREFFQRLAKVSSPEEAFMFSHIEDPVVGPLIQESFRRSKDPARLMFNSMLRTSLSPNIIKGGFRPNVIPAEAEATVDVRLLPGDSREDLIERLKQIVNDPTVEIMPFDFATMPPSPVSRLDSEMFRAIEKAQATVFPGAATLPEMSTGATDSASLRVKGVQAYGVGVPATDDDMSRMHGNDERVSVEGMGKYVEYVYRAVVDVAGAR